MKDKDKKKSEPNEQDPRYPREELLVNAEALFNVRPEVLVAALTGDTRQDLSVPEARAAIERFQKRRVN